MTLTRSTFCFLIDFFSLFSNSLVWMFSIAVSSVILADALSVEDVVRIEVLERGLLEVVDGCVLEDVAVEVASDDLNDGVAEVVSLGIEVDEVELLSYRLQRLGELGVEELVERLRVRTRACSRSTGRP